MRCTVGNSLLMNRTEQRMIKVCWKTCTNIASAEGKALPCRKNRKTWQRSGGSLTAEWDWRESATEGCCQATPELCLTRSRDELHHNTLRGSKKWKKARKETVVFFSHYLSWRQHWDSSHVHRSKDWKFGATTAALNVSFSVWVELSWTCSPVVSELTTRFINHGSSELIWTKGGDKQKYLMRVNVDCLVLNIDASRAKKKPKTAVSVWASADLLYSVVHLHVALREQCLVHHTSGLGHRSLRLVWALISRRQAKCQPQDQWKAITYGCPVGANLALPPAYSFSVWEIIGYTLVHWHTVHVKFVLHLY